MKIIRVVGTEVHTTEDAVITAAAIATWRAIYPNELEPKPVFDEHWIGVEPR